MAGITLQGNPIETVGELPEIGTESPDFTLVAKDLSEISLQELLGSRLILNIFPSLDTGICAMSVRRFNSEASDLPGVKVLCISADLPFAHARFCETEGLEDVINLSVFRNRDFGEDYGVEILTGPLQGLLSRAIIVLEEDGKVIYTQQVPEIAQEPDYQAALVAARI